MFIRLSNAPDYNFCWTIYLKNGKKVKVNIAKNYPPSFAFAISYKWHDLGLRRLETVLQENYSQDYCYLDIGANHGLRSIYALSTGRFTYLFEPNNNLNYFVINLFQLNSYQKYKLENKCLSDKSGLLKFYLSPSTYLSSLSKENALQDNEKGEVREIEVQVITVDEYFQGKNDKIGIIKIDVEGHEYEVLKGAINTLIKFKPAIIVEILAESKKKKQLYYMMKTLGYQCYAIKNKNMLTLIKYEKENIFEDTHFANNYLFTLNEEYLSEAKIISSDKYI